MLNTWCKQTNPEVAVCCAIKPTKTTGCSIFIYGNIGNLISTIVCPVIISVLERENKRNLSCSDLQQYFYLNTSYHVLVVTYNSRNASQIKFTRINHCHCARRGTLPRTWWGYRSVCHSTSNYKFNRNKIPFLKTINKMKL